MTLNQRDAIAANPSADLRERLGEQMLLKLALDAVQSLDPSKLNSAVSSDPGIRPQMMLTLLAYCYAARIYGSWEIEAAIRNDPTVRYICARTFLIWRDIRHFRRNNRDLIERCLAYVLKQAWLLERDELEGESIPWNSTAPALNRDFGFAAREKIDVAIIMDMPARD